MSRSLDDLDGGQQHLDVIDVDMLQLLGGVESHDLGSGRVQPRSAGSHPIVDVVVAKYRLTTRMFDSNWGYCC